jgi:hypothetical protein
MRRIVFPFSSFDGYSQRCSFPNQPNRDKISTRKFDVGVFTPPGPISDMGWLFSRSPPIPIVFIVVPDPIGSHIVDNLARPPGMSLDCRQRRSH